MDKIDNPQQYANEIELALRRLFNCANSGFFGILSSDDIRENFFPRIMSGLTYKYSLDKSKKEQIEDFMKKYINILDSKMSIDDILSLKKDCIVNEFGIDSQNGKEAINKIICDFIDIIK